MIIRSPSISTDAGLSTSPCQFPIFVGFKLSHQARTTQKHPKHNSAARMCSLYLAKITTRITTYKIVSGTLSADQRTSMYRAAMAHKESTETTNQTSARPNPVNHLAASPRVGCAPAMAVLMGASAEISCTRKPNRWQADKTSFLKTSHVVVVAFPFPFGVIDSFLHSLRLRSPGNRLAHGVTFFCFLLR